MEPVRSPPFRFSKGLTIPREGRDKLCVGMFVRLYVILGLLMSLSFDANDASVPAVYRSNMDLIAEAENGIPFEFR